MIIKVNIENEILGNSLFWSGEDIHIFKIKNVIAKELAIKVAKDGMTRRQGMWVVSGQITKRG